MNLLSTRFLKATLALLVVTAALVSFVSLNPRHIDPCRNPGSLAVTGLIAGARHELTKESRGRIQRLLWAEGTFENPLHLEHPFRYRIVRSHDLLYLATRPVNLVSDKIDAEHHRVEMLEVDGTAIPVHVVEDYTKQPHRLIGYYHVYGLEPVESPISTHVRNLPGVLRQGTPALTTVVVDAPIDRRGREEAEERMMEWLGDSWRFFDQHCPSPRDR